MGRAPPSPQAQPARDRSPTNGASGREHAERAARQARLSLAGGLSEDAEPAVLLCRSCSRGPGLLALLPEPPAQSAAGLAAKEGGVCRRGRSPAHQLAALLHAFVYKVNRGGCKIIVPLIAKPILQMLCFFFYLTNSLCLFVSLVASAHQSPTSLFSARFISKDGIMAAVKIATVGSLFYLFLR